MQFGGQHGNITPTVRINWQANTIMESEKLQPRGRLWQVTFPQNSSLYLSVFEVAVEFGFKQEAYGTGWGAKSCGRIQDIK